MEKEEQISYMHMIVGSIGMLLLIFGILAFVADGGHGMGLPLIFLGFGLMMHYMYQLEKKTGISNKLVLMRSIILSVIILGFVYLYY